MFLLLFDAHEGEKLEGLKASQDNTRAKVAANRDLSLVFSMKGPGAPTKQEPAR
jgi:hypothetical protein